MTIQTLVQYNKRDDVLSTNLRFAWLQSANAGLYIVYNEVDENNLLFAPRENAQQFAIKYSRILNILIRSGRGFSPGPSNFLRQCQRYQQFPGLFGLIEALI